jgi:hypothetical protein
MSLHPRYLALLCLSALFARASEPASHAPFAVTYTRPAAIPSASDESAELVDRLVRSAAALDASLPSITAHEVVETEQAHGILTRRSQGEGTVRVLRIADRGILEETHQMTDRNGKPLASDDRKAPAQLSDGFIGAQEMFFSRATRPCFTFTLAPQATFGDPLKLSITLSPNYASMPGCPSGLEGLTGVALVDSTTHQLTHLERMVPAAAGALDRYVSTNYEPASVGDKTFWLPALTLSSGIQGKTRTYTMVSYSDYHQYAASVTVLADASQ